MKWFDLDGKCHDGCPALRYEQEHDTYRYGQRFCLAWDDAGLEQTGRLKGVGCGGPCVMARLRRSLLGGEMACMYMLTGRAAQDVQKALREKEQREVAAAAASAVETEKTIAAVMAEIGRRPQQVRDQVQRAVDAPAVADLGETVPIYSMVIPRDKLPDGVKEKL